MLIVLYLICNQLCLFNQAIHVCHFLSDNCIGEGTPLSFDICLMEDI
jgi:hypothetical protein